MGNPGVSERRERRSQEEGIFPVDGEEGHLGRETGEETQWKRAHLPTVGQ